MIDAASGEKTIRAKYFYARYQPTVHSISTRAYGRA